MLSISFAFIVILLLLAFNRMAKRLFDHFTSWLTIHFPGPLVVLPLAASAITMLDSILVWLVWARQNLEWRDKDDVPPEPESTSKKRRFWRSKTSKSKGAGIDAELGANSHKS